MSLARQVAGRALGFVGVKPLQVHGDDIGPLFNRADVCGEGHRCAATT